MLTGLRTHTIRWFTARLALGLAACGPGCLQAAVLELRVADAAGAPLGDAVALLEPVGVKATVRPMEAVEISQSKRRFNPRVTLITTGTRVTFPNFDTVRHQVYSFSPIKTFEIKLYAGVPGVPVVFDLPGIAVLGCNIHDSMAAWVVVSDTPWAARSGPDGRIRIEGVPAGAYRLRTWHPGLATGTDPAALALTIGTADVALPLQLPVKDEP
ncbi:MAG: methylamine utilization protein [Pseudomonadota bacterium]|nr:methylamine utilization protein [Pseudomonadota bacterium]